jgi:hypothetical protein
MRPGGFKCCWYEDSNIAGLREAVADAAYAFLTAQLAKRGVDPYLAAPFSRGCLLRRAGLPFSFGQTPACGKAVHKLCTPWAQHMGVPAPPQARPLDTTEQGRRGRKRRNYMYLKDKTGITESIDVGHKRH